MSRIAKYPVAVPDKVQVTVDNQAVTVKGPLGTLKHALSPDVTVKVDASTIIRKQVSIITLADIKAGDEVNTMGTRVDDHTEQARQIEVRGSSGHH